MTDMPRANDNDNEDEDEAATIEPGTITRIARRRRERGRFAVEIDGRAGLTLSEEVLVRAGLQVGDTVDAAALADLARRDETVRATEAALNYLAYRPRSEREVRDRLRRGGYEADTIERVMEKLRDWRYLDDTDFARRWVEGRTAQRPRGKRLLEQELRQKGIAAETAREIVDEADLDEAGAAEELARRRLPSYAADDPMTARRRLSAYLMRRGYGYDIVRGAVERAMGTTDEAEEGFDNEDD
jgi:regulatory protein